jgi:hypothetical protein
MERIASTPPISGILRSMSVTSGYVEVGLDGDQGQVNAGYTPQRIGAPTSCTQERGAESSIGPRW